VEVGEDSPLVLVPTSPTRFRIESMNGTATFQVSEGRVTGSFWSSPERRASR
jgi:hypothetical protein